MSLIPNWRAVARKAWSVRLALLAGLFSAAEVVLPLFADALPRGAFALLSFVAVGGAAAARIVAQPEMHQ